jgi:HlyD family secretion protein
VLSPQGLKLAVVPNELWQWHEGSSELHRAFEHIRAETAEDAAQKAVKVFETDHTCSTFVFQTRKGAMGLLQVVDADLLKIRFKLLQPQAEAPRTNSPKVNPAAELKKLQGQWKVVKIEKGKEDVLVYAIISSFTGEPSVVDPDFASMIPGHIEFTEPSGRGLMNVKYFRVQGAEKVPLGWVSGLCYQIDPSTSPKAIDLCEDEIGNEEHKLLKAIGIYEIEGDRMKICFARYMPTIKMSQRPESFDLQPDSANIVIFLERFQPPKNESLLQGNYKLISLEEDGKPLSEEECRRKIYSFANDEITISQKDTKGGSSWFGMQYAIHPSQQPAGITVYRPIFTFAQNGQPTKYEVLRGIYNLDANKGTLTIAYRAGDKPPEKFESTPGSGVTLLILKTQQSMGPGQAVPVSLPQDKAGAQPGQTPTPQKTSDASHQENNPRSPPVLRTAAITRGDIAETISATGTLEPEDICVVASSVAGPIIRFGDDPRGAKDANFKGKPVDYNTPVEKGTILAEIDPTPYKARVDQESAAMMRAKAELELARAKTKDQTPEVAKASMAAAEASLNHAKSVLDGANRDLANTIVKSPVAGVIIDRRVNVGQNVSVAGPNLPSLFLIAKDLKKMQVWASVAEADIARIHQGMEVRFTVDAFPKETFKALVSQIRLNAMMTQNIVTYTVVLDFENPDLKLMPYMTANLHFLIEKHENVLLVPNAALRWAPDGNRLSKPISWHQGHVVWEKSPDGNKVYPHEVKIGLTDGKMTEVSGPDIKEGLEVVIGEGVAKDDSPTANPFLPKKPEQPGEKSIGKKP